MRNKLLDQIRFCAAFMVILIHAPLPGWAGQLLEAICRVAVPLFFMVSGYFAQRKDKKSVLKSAKKTAIMLSWSVGIYFLWGILWSFYNGNIKEKLLQYFSLQSLAETLFLNTGTLLGHLWFLLALLYSYLIYAMLLRKTSVKVRTGLLTVLLAGSFVIRELLRQNGILDPMYYLRNFLFIGLPFFLLGGVINEGKEYIIRIPANLWILIALLGTGAAVVERFLVGCFDLYMGSVVAAVALFILAQTAALPSVSVLADLGEKYAGDIYIFHPMIITILAATASVTGILNTATFQWGRPVVVLAVSIAVSYIWEAVTGKLLKLSGNSAT